MHRSAPDRIRPTGTGTGTTGKKCPSTPVPYFGSFGTGKMTNESQMQVAAMTIGETSIALTSRANSPQPMAPAEKPRKFMGIDLSDGGKRCSFTSPLYAFKECNLLGNPREWWTDSGAIHHVYANKELFSSFVLAQVEEMIYMAKSTTAKKNDLETFKEAMSSSDLSFWKEAINSKIDSILSNHTWELVDLPLGNKPLGSKWIFKRKMKADGTIDKYKARLVVKGFKQKEGLDYFDTYLPITRITSIRILFALAAVYSLEIHQMDVKITFLHGELEDEIYMEQPEGFMVTGKENKAYLEKEWKGHPRKWSKAYAKSAWRFNIIDYPIHSHDVDNGKMTNESQMQDVTTTMGATSIASTSRANALQPMESEEKLKKFVGINFKRWQQEMFFYLTTLCLKRFTTEDAPEVLKGTSDKEHFMIVEFLKHSDFLCRNYILISLQDDLYSVYILIVNEAFQVAVIIEKLTPMWKDFKNYLKHKLKEMTVEDLIVRLHMEEDNKAVERRSKGNSTINGAHIVEDDQNNSKKRKKAEQKSHQPKKKFKGKCFNYGKIILKFMDCRVSKKGNKKYQANIIESNKECDNLCAMFSECNLVGNPCEWWMDSGAIRHVCANKELFSSFAPAQVEEMIYMANSAMAKVLDKFKYIEFGIVKTPLDVSFALQKNEGFSNSNWITGSNEVKSTSGYVSTIGGGAVSWKSSKQTCIARSIMEAKFIALDKVSEEVEWLWNFFEDIPYWPKPVASICLHGDSQAAIGRAESIMYNAKDILLPHHSMPSRFTTEDAPEVPEETLDKEHFMIVEALKHSDFLCRNYILSDLQDDLYNVYKDNNSTERRSNGNSTINGAHIVEDDQNNSKKRKKAEQESHQPKKKFIGKYFNCGKIFHMFTDCRAPKEGKKKDKQI
ncbi:hypothetical protein FXO38_34397 [Capsicum annuum]|nr:hypothetical protein FXO38_34397 [Capsicum annuum]